MCACDQQPTQLYPPDPGAHSSPLANSRHCRTYYRNCIGLLSNCSIIHGMLLPEETGSVRLAQLRS